jgi:hypothetical protein
MCNILLDLIMDHCIHYSPKEVTFWEFGILASRKGRKVIKYLRSACGHSMIALLDTEFRPRRYFLEATIL